MDSEYEVIAKNDTRPRYIDVTAGRMYLFLCDSPTSSPYLSSMIFTSFVILSGFILISLTVAAVSGGVHSRLEEIQREGLDDEDFDDEYLESLSDVAGDLHASVTEVSKESTEKEILRKIRTHTFYGKGQTDGIHPTATPAPGDDRQHPERMSAFQEDSEEDKEEEKSDCSHSEFQDQEPGPPARMISWLGAGHSEVTAEGASEHNNGLPPLSHDLNLSSNESSNDIRVASLTSTELARANLSNEQSIPSPHDATPNEITQPRPMSELVKTSTAINHKIFRSNSSLRRHSKEELPLLHDKELIRMMLRQFWTDVEAQKKKRLEEQGAEGEADPLEEKSSESGRFFSPREAIRCLPLSSGPNGQSFVPPLQRGTSFRQNIDVPAVSSSSTKSLAYFFRNALTTYFYLAYVILIVLVTASFQIYCTNNDNCESHCSPSFRCQDR